MNGIRDCVRITLLYLRNHLARSPYMIERIQVHISKPEFLNYKIRPFEKVLKRGVGRYQAI